MVPNQGFMRWTLWAHHVWTNYWVWTAWLNGGDGKKNDLPCQYYGFLAFDCLGPINIGHGNHLPHLARVMFIELFSKSFNISGTPLLWTLVLIKSYYSRFFFPAVFLRTLFLTSSYYATHTLGCVLTLEYGFHWGPPNYAGWFTFIRWTSSFLGHVNSWPRRLRSVSEWPFATRGGGRRTAKIMGTPPMAHFQNIVWGHSRKKVVISSTVWQLNDRFYKSWWRTSFKDMSSDFPTWLESFVHSAAPCGALWPWSPTGARKVWIAWWTSKKWTVWWGKYGKMMIMRLRIL